MNINDDDLQDYEDINYATKTHTNESKTKTQKAFSDFNLNEQLLYNIKFAQFENPSPVKIIAIPKILLGNDVLCQAKSGTGKTAVFVLSTLQLLQKNTNIKKIGVVAHTNDLVEQILGEYVRFSSGMNFSIENLEKIKDNVLKPQPDIVVGTPFLFNSHKNYSYDVLVVDECDFIVSDNVMHEKLKQILKCNRKYRNNFTVLMFTATLTKVTKTSCLDLLKNPFEIYVNDDTELTLHGLKQFYVDVHKMDKISLIKHFVSYNKQTIIFCLNPSDARNISSLFYPNSQSIGTFTTSHERQSILNAFKNKKFSLLATTDILSRGIDIIDIEMVINYDVPHTPQLYLHRVGRAGRFESEGMAITFVTNQLDRVRLNAIMYRYEIDIVEYEDTKNTFS